MSYQLRLSTLLVVLLAGCNGGLREEPGPVPLNAPDKGPIRLRKRTGGSWLSSYNYATYWDEGSGPALASNRISNLKSAIPAKLLEKLSTTRSVPYPVRLSNNKHVKPLPSESKGTFDQPVHDSHATVVSLTPDVLIVTVRTRPDGSYDGLFDAWYNVRKRKLRDEIAFLRYGPERVMTIYAGTKLPASSEMYVVSTDKRIPFGRLKFDRDRAVIRLSSGRLVVTRDGDVAAVKRE